MKQSTTGYDLKVYDDRQTEYFRKLYYKNDMKNGCKEMSTERESMDFKNVKHVTQRMREK